MAAAVSPRGLSLRSNETVLRDITENPGEIPPEQEGSQNSLTLLDESPLRPGLIRGRKDRKRSPTSPAATRRLGGSVRAKKDGQVIIPDPMKDEMERRHKHANRHLRGVYPVNTLDAPSTKPASARANFLPHTKAQRVYVGRGEINKANITRGNDYTRPSKKQRTGPSPKDGKQESPIEVDDSQEFQGFDDDIQQAPNPPSFPAQRMRRKGQLEAVDFPRSHQANGTQAKKQPPDPQQLAAIDQILEKEQNRASAVHDHSQLSSDDSLMGEPLIGRDGNNNGVEFVRAAATKRKAGQYSSPERWTIGEPMQQEFVDLDLVAHKPSSPPSRNGRPPETESPDPIQQSGSNQHSWKQHNRTSPSRKSAIDLSHSITGNRNNRKLTRPKSEAGQSNTPDRANVLSWHVVDVAGYFIARSINFYNFYIDLDKADFWFDTPNPQLDIGSIMTALPIKKIQIIQHGHRSSKVFVNLSHSQNMTSNTFIMELKSRKKVNDMVETVQSLDNTIKIKERPDVWLENAFEKQIRDSTEWSINAQHGQADRSRSNAATTSTSSEYFTSHGENRKRAKLTDNLDGPKSKPVGQTVIRPEDRLKATQEMFDELPVPRRHDQDKWKDQAGRDDTSSRYFSGKATRSQTLRSVNQVEMPKYRSPTPKLKYSQSVGLGPKWKNDLVYPKEGKKRETVEYGDLLRLDEDEFLNDVLIGFFARYLQHDVELRNPPLLRSIHFFSSYFFDTLTKSTKLKKDINYSAVARWTKNIDIFNRDFVIVPVNDNLHWYLAIICNLKRLTRKKHSDEEDDIEEAEISDGGIQIIADYKVFPKGNSDHDAEQGQKTRQTQKSFQELTLDDTIKLPPSPTEPKQSSQTEVGPSPARAKPGRKKKVKTRKSLPKYDTEIPIIITLDSLAQPRSAAIAALKQYVVLEAKAKRNVAIEKEDIKGMTAKGIPSQGNYSDCGLFMCMYLEQFMADPYGFVRKILQREEGELRWPKTIRSERLRTRLRDLIIELHHRQEGGEPEKEIPPLGKIMAEMRDPSPEAIASTPPHLSRSRTSSSNLDNLDGQHIQQIRQELEHISGEVQNVERHLNSEGHLLAKEGAQPPSSASHKRALEECLHQVDHDPVTTANSHEPIVIENDSPEKSAKRLKRPPTTTKLPPFKPPRPVKTIQSPKSSGPPVQEGLVEDMLRSDPQDLADQMRAARNSPPRRTKAKMTSPVKRNVRSDSVSTEFLSGLRSYAAHAHDLDEELGKAVKDASESEPDGEVPETQELDIEELVASESQRLRARAQKRDSQEEMLV